MNNIDQLSINAIRILSAEAVEKANGHPGMPMGAAPMAYTLWAKVKTQSGNPMVTETFCPSAGHDAALFAASLIWL